MAESIRDVTIRAKIEITNAAEARESVKATMRTADATERMKKAETEVRKEADAIGKAMKKIEGQQKQINSLLEREKRLREQIAQRARATKPPPLPKSPAIGQQGPGLSGVLSGFGGTAGMLAGAGGLGVLAAVPVIVTDFVGRAADSMNAYTKSYAEGKSPAEAFSDALLDITPGSGTAKKLQEAANRDPEAARRKFIQDQETSGRQKVLQLIAQERQQIEELNREKLEAIQKEIESARIRQKAADTELKAAISKRENAAGEFGLLSGREQRDVLQLLERLKTGGVGAIGKEGVERLKGFGFAEDLLKKTAISGVQGTPEFARLTQLTGIEKQVTDAERTFVKATIAKLKAEVKYENVKVDLGLKGLEDLGKIVARQTIPLLLKVIRESLQEEINANLDRFEIARQLGNPQFALPQ